ncbi:SRPBCC family protein [Baia soyae]|uniref:Uncharacterized protein YndB with AHSA1/START domain n=1 Tax=Baia soyae TaxID=1544746 RepID=A0A4R2RHD1_9BACL|nr:SRPBCC family protein [Baia soyae]TCP61537.1 uncharacterized protein YndB with AHSA1/START domain [Baia soyae]
MITYSMDIQAPIEHVFQFIDEEEKTKLWMKELVGTTYIGTFDPENPVGTKFKQKLKEGGRIAEYDGEVLAYEKPKLLSIRLGNKMFSVDVTYQLSETPNGTRLHYTCTQTFHTFLARVMGTLFSGFMKKIFQKQMKALKEVAESR